MKKTRFAFLQSILSLLLCVSMLAGTTFAWFTDTVTSTENIIQSGILDAELLYRNPEDTEYSDASKGAIFSYDLWEPGYVEAKIIRIENRGNLSFRYHLNLIPDATAEGGKPNLADVIDVYIFDPADTIDRETISGATPAGTLSEMMTGAEGAVHGVLLPAGSNGSEPAGFAEYCIILKMREDAGNEYQNLSVGDGITVKLFATQYTWEEDSFGKDYDNQTGSVITTRQTRILPNVIADQPENALASSPGVQFGNSPYAYTDTSLFAGKHITRIGIPVKSVKALDDKQTFTLSVVKTGSAARAASDTYTYVSRNVLTLPREQLGDFTTVNKWVYVDVDLHLAEDETLAFGMPTDTVEWGYSTANNSQYNFRSASGGWNQTIKQSIFFDVYTSETLEFKETEYGLAVVTEGRALPNVLTAFPESDIAASNPVEFPTAPYSYLDQTLFSGSRITKIGIPVKTVKALDENQTFTLSVVKNGTSAYQYVSQYVLTLPLEQLGSSTTVNKWVYVDVDLLLAEDETLAFGGTGDTVTWGWKRNYSDTSYKFRSVTGSVSNAIFFDVCTETVLTYDAYLKQQQEEQERLEAEQAQARLDAQLKQVLSGRGISILGDSISTYQGWSNNTGYNSTIGGNYVYYTGSRDGFATVTETWWMQTITRSGLELVVNNSWSGDRVVDRGISRSLQLHNNEGTKPDIIAVYLGINDFRTKVTADTFRIKYDEMISGILEKYEDADVYLFTLLYTTNVNSGVKPADVVTFNEIIAETAEKYELTLVDLYNDTGITSENLASYMGDKVLHPNYAGMDRITQCFMDALVENYLP